jgi:transcription initiation factor TFIID TATA-box-binding protein
MPSAVETIDIQNVVASSGIGQEIDLQALAMDLPDASYEPEKFPGLVYKTTDPSASALIFRSGKLVCTGADGVDEVHAALDNVFDALRERGLDVDDDPVVEVQNIVSSADIGATLNLNAIAIGLGLESVEYEPEQFPGLVYRIDEPDVVVLLFGSGKLVITGATTPEDAGAALEVVREELDALGLLG